MLPRRRRTASENENQALLNKEETWTHNKFSQINSSYPNNVGEDFYLDDHSREYNDPDPVMTARDRTSEFVNTIQTLQGRNFARANATSDTRKSKVIQNHSDFMLIAKNVGKNIASTYAKLEKLTLLAKRKSLFDDRTAEIQELTYIIKNDLNSLNQQIAQLQNLSRSQKNLSNGKHLQSHSSNIVLALQSKLATMSTDFKQVLEVRTENLKHQKRRRDQFSQGSMPPPAANVGQSSILFQEEDHVSIDFGSASTSQQPQQHMQALMYDQTDDYLQSRAETMQNIESTIVELGGIFQQLAHMVKEQEEMVERIDTNVQDAEINIEAAHNEILRYFRSVSSNRWLMIKIFGVLIFFFIFFVVFLA
ncbi:syntaxin-5 [Cylas formicarius]|uniref:syntaxin-5 n=1 Tax=Cylas formicarius TaxID=197179 RepID=UPI0029587BFC|nr:syntaxin-5 [Cylas formicarius]